MNQRVIISHNLATDLALSMSECEHDRIFVLVDETTKQHCWPVISQFIGLRNATVITIGASDTHKNIDSLMHVWKELDNGMATRHSLLINLGGGMVTDLGGFAASTFKRGDSSVTVEDYYTDGCPAVVIKLDPLKTPQQNSAAMFKEYTKLKTAEAHLTALVAEGEKQLDYLNSVLDELSERSTPLIVG